MPNPVQTPAPTMGTVKMPNKSATYAANGHCGPSPAHGLLKGLLVTKDRKLNLLTEGVNMKFNNLVAIIATISFAIPVNAQDGTLRRVAQNDQTTTVTTEVNTTTVAPQAVQTSAPAASVQPATVVEAAPVSESKAESLRKARQGAEISTEQKIVEKLEESRLKEEQDRADRLFGNKLDSSAQKQLDEAAKAQSQGPVAPAPVVAPVAPAPAQVTIEKVEIIQPAPVPAPEIKSVEVVKETPAPAPAAAASISASQADVEEDETPSQKYYVSAALGAVNYDASNVKGNFGGGVSVGMLVNERSSVELGFLYSNAFIDTFWEAPIYREMDQYDISFSAKYNILTGRIRPYVGGGAAYIIRNYQQRLPMLNANGTVSSVAGPSEDQTDSVNLMLMAGADFQVSETISIGAGVDYSTNIMNRSEINFQNYGINPEGTKAIEEIDFFTTKVHAKMTF